ncbi:MAG: hypothetical protein ABI822_23290 [Bryobacteraceae bacterium]
MLSRYGKWLLCAVPAILAVRALADLEGSYVLPLDDDAIGYETAPLHDAITLLQAKLNDSTARLSHHPDLGYLPGLLKALNVPVSSQTLVFSKTSFQAPRISPHTPRAVYFNDTVSVGYVRGGDVLEISVLDPKQGVIFYTLDQERTRTPQIQRRQECLQCHASSKSLGIPGNILRSIYPDSSGQPLFQAGGFITDHRSPMKERWGGWYVTGTHGSQLHMGNTFVEKPAADPTGLDLTAGANITDLSRRFDTGAYLSPHSDIVALMVLEHQIRMQNLIIRVGFESRMALHSQADINRMLGKPVTEFSESTVRRINNPAEYLVSYMLFTDEALLTEPVAGTSGFTAEFPRQGPRDRKGRSLRDFDLARRVFRYPCSYMIYSEAFDQLPEPTKERIYRRLWEVLTGRDQTKAYATLTAADRQAVLEILRETKPGLPAYWQGS